MALLYIHIALEPYQPETIEPYQQKAIEPQQVKLVKLSKNTSIEDKKLQGKVINTFVKGKELFKL